MNAVYELEDGRSLALYMEGNRVLALTTPLRRGALPALLKNDCLGKLYSALYRGNISYVYENFSHQIVFDTVNPVSPRVILSPTADASRFDGILLRELSGQLCLIFQAWNPINENYSLYCQNVFSGDEPDLIYKGYTRRLQLQWLTCGEGEYLMFLEAPEPDGADLAEAAVAETAVAGVDASGGGEADWEAPGHSPKVRERWYKIEDAHFFAQTRPGGGSEGGLRASGSDSSECEAQLATVREDYEGQLAAAREEHAAQLATVREDCEAQLAAAQKNHETQLAAVRDDCENRLRELKGRCSLLESAVADYEERLAQMSEAQQARQKALEERAAKQLQSQKAGYEAQLESAKKQYAELAKTAVELQKVGRLWRDKYLGDNH